MLRTFMRALLELLWREWQLVGTFQHTFKYREDYSEKECTVYIHCFESRWGSRKVSITVARLSWFNGSFKKRAILGELYQTKVHPWLNGRINTEIPGFQLVKSKKWDFKKLLKGETPIVLNDDEK